MMMARIALYIIVLLSSLKIQGDFLQQLMNMVVIKEISIIMIVYMMMICSGAGTDMKTDKAALLAFKGTIISDPYSVLANWNESTHVCNFFGVQCGSGHELHRVVMLDLSIDGLVGTLSPFISSLTHLRELHLSGNHFYVQIPSQLSSLGKLEHLVLAENDFSGPIPPDSFSYLRNLKWVSMWRNKLNGPIPPSLFSNCTFLRDLDLSENQLSGRIPPEIGNCPGLDDLYLSNNQLTGEIPLSLTNATDLFFLNIEHNHLSGELPVSIVPRLPNIISVHLSYNNMISQDGNTNLEPFFTALSNCTVLLELRLAGMGLGAHVFTGIPENLGTLDLKENQIRGSISIPRA